MLPAELIVPTALLSMKTAAPGTDVMTTVPRVAVDIVTGRLWDWQAVIRPLWNNRYTLKV